MISGLHVSHPFLARTAKAMVYVNCVLINKISQNRRIYSISAHIHTRKILTYIEISISLDIIYSLYVKGGGCTGWSLRYCLPLWICDAAYKILQLYPFSFLISSLAFSIKSKFGNQFRVYCCIEKIRNIAFSPFGGYF